MQPGSSPPPHMELQSGRTFSTPGRPAGRGSSYASPGPAATPPSAGAPPAGESPTSSGVRSSSEVEYSEHARLVNSSALSDDGMTPLIQPARSKRERVTLLAKRVALFLLAHWSKAAILGVLITLIVLVSVKGFGFFGDVLSWFQRHNGWGGWGIFVGMYTAVVALFLPGVVLILGAGFIFGFWRGLLAVWAGGAVGQALAFLLARYLFRSWVENTLRHKWAKWAIIDKAIEQDGWKLVLILRFSPIIPYNLLNIAMATTSIPFWQFTIVSAVGIVYECAVFAYFGSMADNIHSIIAGKAGAPPIFEWVMLGISAVMCVVGALFVSYSIKRAIRRAQTRMSHAELDALGLAGDEEQGRREEEAVGVRVHHSYPASLEREGFLGSSSTYNLPSSPEFELKAVAGSSVGATAGGSGSTAAAAAARDKPRLLSNGSGVVNASGSGPALLAVTAASGSGTLQASLGSLGLGSARSGSTKAKISPQHSSTSSLLGNGGGEDGELGRGEAKATRRHPSISNEHMV
ncbi:hypothetical protein ABPG75_002128 [Micractinium tetrahymenae]